MLRRRTETWRPSRPVRFMLGAFLALYLTLGATVLFGQNPGEPQVRHFLTPIMQNPASGNLEELHLFLDANGRMGAVLFFGPAGENPQFGEIGGPRTYTDVNSEGDVAFCFTTDFVDGTATEALLGLVSCWLWSEDGDTMTETGETPFGEPTSIPLTWCGETHYSEPVGDPIEAPGVFST